MALRQRFRNLADKLAVDAEPGLSTTQLMLVNHDLKPVERERRQWGPWNFVAFWIADSFNINTWMISSSMIIAGLSWWQAWICVWLGYSISACFIVMTGRIGATYHIGFPVIGRASFGIWGSLWPVFNRAAMACIWYGVQAYIGGTCVYLMIRSIWNGVMSSIANFATLVVNDSDFTRFARKPRDAVWSQLLTIPLGFAITSFIGIIVSSSSTVIYDQPIWSPLDLLGRFIDDGGSGQRFGVFVIALAFALAQLGTNIAANSVSAGTDMTALLPRYINIRRGSYICAVVGLAMCPYNLLSSSNQFTTYLSAYSVFLSSIAGVIVSDYYLVRRGYLETKELYDSRSTGPYFYTWGVHWRAYAAYIAGILINVVGFAGAVGTKVPMGATYIYRLNFFCGFLVSLGVYWALCKVSPVPATSDRWMEVGEDLEDEAQPTDDGSYDEEREAGVKTLDKKDVREVNF
ncbi:hypothetical protein M440DRAFT_1333319 [Trichoderma longibrachiatum ATCC 18648]|uniref:Uracil permease n=1 Tax=Trichoderma longibrachiatum ATCC 18648 TaxID=983965 RepID=A0A2T4C4F9_TRILO|nr:hypothetical protein M440DRAFT_1333319 [Trichoderma longibrachiatum ATCC 18648]